MDFEIDERRSQPCRYHGDVLREMQLWTGGPHFVCPRCEDTLQAVRVLDDALERYIKSGEPLFMPYVHDLCGAIVHVLSDRKGDDTWQ